MRGKRYRAIALLLACCLLAGCGKADKNKDTEQEPTETTVSGPQPVVAGSGNSAQLDCMGSYVRGGESHAQVARVGEQTLDNSVLRVFYNLEVGSYRISGGQPQPKYTEPLFAQSCPLTDGLSWEHYFLERALDRWHTCQALYSGSQQPQIITAKHYEPSADLHGKYFAKTLPAYPLLFQNRDSFQPNSMHQAFLDSIPELLEQLAQEQGAASAAELAQKLAGPDAQPESLQDAVHLINYAYAYFTELSYAAEVTQEELESYLSIHPGRYTNSEMTVTIVHCLLRPEGAQVDSSGKVTATEKQWNDCLKKINELQMGRKGNWLTRRNPSNTFLVMANQNSADLGTRASGGRYTCVRRGQLHPQIEEWAFAPERKYGDETQIQTDLGYELVLFESSETVGTAQAREDCLQEKYRELVQDLKATYPIQVDYDKISLTEAAPGLTLADVLYSDVAHERYPQMPVYLQQDFSRAPFSAWTVGRHGCGITTLAMLATHMSDRLYTPADLAAMYPTFATAEGTDGTIFAKIPPELGFFCEKTCWDWPSVEQALQSGQVAVSLQFRGYFTKTGHYLAMIGLTEDGDVILRDSNIYNYDRLDGHKVDHFNPQLIIANNSVYWIFQPKIRRIEACSRCGNPDTCGMPEGLLLEEYTCEKCTAALSRRSGFLELCQ